MKISAKVNTVSKQFFYFTSIISNIKCNVDFEIYKNKKNDQDGYRT